MVAWWWSWLLTTIGVAGLVLVGRKNKIGWVIAIGVQGLWITYAVITKQWGFIASALIYGGVNLYNWNRWRREERRQLEDLRVPR